MVSVVTQSVTDAAIFYKQYSAIASREVGIKVLRGGYQSKTAGGQVERGDDIAGVVIPYSPANQRDGLAGRIEEFHPFVGCIRAWLRRVVLHLVD